jgi:hypothetical protein
MSRDHSREPSAYLLDDVIDAVVDLIDKLVPHLCFAEHLAEIKRASVIRKEERQECMKLDLSSSCDDIANVFFLYEK